MTGVEAIFNPSPVSADLFHMLAGDELGFGISRTVFDWRLDKGYVIKFEVEGAFQNIAEWQVWERIKETPLSKWFSPCKHISPCGRILIQRKTQEFKSDKQLPKKIPSFFTDVKSENWGMLDGRAVCHDYGYHLLLEKGMTSRLKLADWRY